MKIPKIERKWGLVILLSVIIPTGLLAIFYLMQVSEISETILVEAVELEIERPDTTVDVHRTIENSYIKDECLIYFNISMDSYLSRHISLGASVKANVSRGFIQGLRISFSEEYNLSYIQILLDGENLYFHVFENLRTQNVVDIGDEGGTFGLGEALKGYVDAAGVNNPSRVRYEFVVRWFLNSPQNRSHQMEVTLELTYNNGTALKKAVLPIQLKLASDSGDNFETAKEISLGEYTGWIHFINDREDYLKIWIARGETVEMQLSSPTYLFKFELYLYDSTRNLVASSYSNAGPYTEKIVFTANRSDWWYIKVTKGSGYGLYTLLINEG